MHLKPIFMTTLFFSSIFFSYAKANPEVEMITKTKSDGKEAIVNYVSDKGKQALVLLKKKKEAYKYVPNPEVASMTDFKVVKFSNYPRKVLFTHWLLGVKNQRVVIFDFHDSDSPIIFDLYSENEMQFKIHKDKIDITYMTYPNFADGVEYSSQTITWNPAK